MQASGLSAPGWRMQVLAWLLLHQCVPIPLQCVPIPEALFRYPRMHSSWLLQPVS